jgi:hypothetical protein
VPATWHGDPDDLDKVTCWRQATETPLIWIVQSHVAATGHGDDPKSTTSLCVTTGHAFNWYAPWYLVIAVQIEG